MRALCPDAKRHPSGPADVVIWTVSTAGLSLRMDAVVSRYMTSRNRTLISYSSCRAQPTVYVEWRKCLRKLRNNKPRIVSMSLNDHGVRAVACIGLRGHELSLGIVTSRTLLHNAPYSMPSSSNFLTHHAPV